MRFVVNGLAAGLLLLLASCGLAAAEPAAQAPAAGPQATAVFAGGCFWCAESDFEHLDGVIGAQSGYTGGALAHPRYEDVTTERTGHYESVRVTYDPSRVSYAQLVAYFFHHIDPLDAGGQFCDRGPSYRSAIFVADDEQRGQAEAIKASVARALGQPVATEILTLGPFWPAEDYHQDYYKKNPLPYAFYRTRCGRDARVHEVWRGH
jgi:peptide-methionine (S)-S-oxide reductase